MKNIREMTLRKSRTDGRTSKWPRKKTYLRNILSRVELILFSFGTIFSEKGWQENRAKNIPLSNTETTKVNIDCWTTRFKVLQGTIFTRQIHLQGCSGRKKRRYAFFCSPIIVVLGNFYCFLKSRLFKGLGIVLIMRFNVRIFVSNRRTVYKHNNKATKR